MKNRAVRIDCLDLPLEKGGRGDLAPEVLMLPFENTIPTIKKKLVNFEMTKQKRRKNSGYSCDPKKKLGTDKNQLSIL